MAIHLSRLLHRLPMAPGRARAGCVMVKTVFTEGGLIIPRKIALGALAALIIGACAQIASYVEAKTATAADIAALQRNDAESRMRGDELRARVKALETLPVSIATIAERQRAQDEVLREIRDLVRRQPR